VLVQDFIPGLAGLLRELTAPLLVAIATRSDKGSHYRLDMMHKVLYQHTMYAMGIYLTLCTFSFEINESHLSDTKCLIQDAMSPHCVDKRMEYGRT
jgi:hypothetical protein